MLGNHLSQPPAHECPYATAVMERPASQMSILEQFLKEMPLGRGGSLESEEGDVEDNRAPSVPSLTSSRSFVSQVSEAAAGQKSRKDMTGCCIGFKK